MVCLGGTGGLSHVSVRHQPDVFNSPLIFAALGVKGQPELARVLEAPVPEWKLYGGPGTANGAGGTSYGLPRLASGTFLARFPFAMAVMRDRRPAIEVTLTGWTDAALVSRPPVTEGRPAPADRSSCRSRSSPAPRARSG